MNNVIERAREFAREAHKGQVRKYTGASYFSDHVEPVAEQVRLTGGTDEMVAAALLHDVIEDTPVTFGEIKNEFGPVIAGIVLELTNEFTHEAYPNMNRKARKEAEAARLGRASKEAKWIKMADLANNTRSILDHDPKFAKVYLQERENLIREMFPAERPTHWAEFNEPEDDSKIEASYSKTEPSQVTLSLFTWLFNHGYCRGHNDTVEGMYTDVQPVDFESYHDDIVSDLIGEHQKRR